MRSKEEDKITFISQNEFNCNSNRYSLGEKHDLLNLKLDSFRAWKIIAMIQNNLSNGKKELILNIPINNMKKIKSNDDFKIEYETI